MYRIRRSIDVDFAHHLRGHGGPCINIHGHTWKFEVVLAAEHLDSQGFVIDFSELTGQVLRPCHDLLDHSLALGQATLTEIGGNLERIGAQLLASRNGRGDQTAQNPGTGVLAGARNVYPGGLKVAAFPFSPTSERLAEWLHTLATERLGSERVRVETARVYETLHPVESVAEYG